MPPQAILFCVTMEMTEPNCQFGLEKRGKCCRASMSLCDVCVCGLVTGGAVCINLYLYIWVCVIAGRCSGGIMCVCFSY